MLIYVCSTAFFNHLGLGQTETRALKQVPCPRTHPWFLWCEHFGQGKRFCPLRECFNPKRSPDTALEPATHTGPIHCKYLLSKLKAVLYFPFSFFVMVTIHFAMLTAIITEKKLNGKRNTAFISIVNIYSVRVFEMMSL